MAVDWETLRQTPTGWEVEDINGEDWFDVKKYLGIESPGRLIEELAAENHRLHRALFAIKEGLRNTFPFTAVAEAERALAAGIVGTQPGDFRDD